MLSQYIVRIADLLEAEGRVAKEGAFRLVAAMTIITAAAMLLMLAVVVLAAAAFLGLLAAGLSPATVCLIVGLGLFVAGVVAVIVARRLGQAKRR
jgi:uncharacterized membrane protein (DUF485 family)